MPLVRKPVGASVAAAAATGAILEGLSSEQEEVRWAAARAAADLDGGAKALAVALRSEPVARVRSAMFTSLARIGSAESIAGVLPLLRSDDANMRSGALESLRIMIRGAHHLLPPLLADADVDVRILSCELARALSGDEANALLCDLLAREPDANVCAAAIDVLSETGQSSALPVLEACAQRFLDTPFLGFAIQIAADRIRTQSASSRG